MAQDDSQVTPRVVATPQVVPDDGVHGSRPLCPGSLLQLDLPITAQRPVEGSIVVWPSYHPGRFLGEQLAPP